MDSPVIVVRTESGAVLIDTALAALVIQHLRWSQPLRYDPLEPFSIELDGKTIYDSTLQREEYLMKQMSPVVAGAIVEALVDPNISIQKLKKRLEQVGLLEPSRKQG